MRDRDLADPEQNAYAWVVQGLPKTPEGRATAEARVKARLDKLGRFEDQDAYHFVCVGGWNTIAEYFGETPDGR